MNADKILKGYGITPTVITKLLKTVDAGLTHGVGDAIPGEMCVEAAVCYALGEDHSDAPACVKDNFRSVKIEINDDWNWKNDKDRARGLRRLAIIQLGTAALKGFSMQRVWDTVSDLAWDDLFNGKFKKLSNDQREHIVSTLNNNGISSESGVLELYFDNPHLACEKIVQACIELELPATKYLKRSPYNPPKGTPAL